LTQIVLLSDLVSHDHMPPEELDTQLRQIATTAKQGVKSLDETVWAINPRNDTVPDLIDYIGNFVMNSLRSAGTRCELDLPEHPPELQVPSEARHALFLVVKEAVHNILRHAKATHVKLTVAVLDDALDRLALRFDRVTDCFPRFSISDWVSRTASRTSRFSVANVSGCQ